LANKSVNCEIATIRWLPVFEFLPPPKEGVGESRVGHHPTLHILSMTYNLTLVYNMQMKLVPMTVNRSSTASLSNSQGGSLDSVAVPSFCARFRPLWFNCTCLKVAPCQWERCDHAGAYLRLSVFRSRSVWPRVSPQVSIRC